MNSEFDAQRAELAAQRKELEDKEAEEKAAIDKKQAEFEADKARYEAVDKQQKEAGGCGVSPLPQILLHSANFRCSVLRTFLG